MSFTRPILFWIAMLAAIIAVVALLREVLLPFVAGMVLAYLLDPLANRIERLGMNRLVATLVIMALAITAITLLIALTVPVIISELTYFIESFPVYLKRLQSLATDPDRPWLSKIVGEGLRESERSISELTTLASSWLGTLLRSIWSGGRELLSIFSLAVVAPIVACYLVYDWNRMIATIDNWVPPARRETVRALAREVNDTIGGFVRGQSALCFVLAVFYAAALWLIGLKHGLRDRFYRRLAQLHSLSRLALRHHYFDVRRNRTILAGLDTDPARTRHFRCRAVAGGLCAGALFGWPARAPESGVGDVRAVRFRLSVRIRGPVDRGAGRSRYRGAHALRAATILCERVVCAGSDRAAARDRWVVISGGQTNASTAQCTSLTALCPQFVRRLL